MTDYTRYAVYYAPPAGSALSRFGARWLGWDAASGLPVPHPECAIDVASITQTPRKYGFHGTLSAPLRLAQGTDAVSFTQAVARLSQGIAPFQTPPLMLKRIGTFLALAPSQPCDALNALHAACVRKLVHFRAPPTEAELTRRRANGLTPEQDALLLRWDVSLISRPNCFINTLV